MCKSISDAMFVKEFQILWQNSDLLRRKMSNIIIEYFGLDGGAKIISKMQEKIKE